MIIQSVRFTDFGIYGGEHTFDLTPSASGQFNRPVVLFSGKNGVGKTTFVEAIRLCLHGSAALGSRVGQQEYLDYLASRIHRPLSSGASPVAASLEMRLEHVSLGHKSQYRVLRKWKSRGKRIEHQVRVWENDDLLDVEDQEQMEALLRELVPLGLVDLFFFDGEKVLTLAQSESSHILLSEAVKSLLGLNLVEQLSKDLDVYISRARGSNGHGTLKESLTELRNREAELQQQEIDFRFRLEGIASSKQHKQQQIGETERQLSGEGRSFAEQRGNLQERRVWLEGQIAQTRREAQEMCNHLAPFAVAHEMLGRVLERLERERLIEEAKTAHVLLERQVRTLNESMRDSSFWLGTKLHPSEDVREHLAAQVALILAQSLPQADEMQGEVILNLSGKERERLQGWIEQARSEVPVKFSQLIKLLDHLEAELQDVNSLLAQVPAEETLRPIMEQLQVLNRDLGQLDKEEEKLKEEAGRIAFALTETKRAISKTHRELTEHKSATTRLDLAARAQLVLEEYQEKLTQRKIAILQESLVRHFNQLCRKRTFIDRAIVDPGTYQVTLFRQGQVFAREELSSGERQLLAIATLWALRDVSGLPTPVIIDTPLSRLDTEHRQSMLQQFFPHVSHQVIVLATDAEIDEQELQHLAPVISHLYRMEYNAETGSTQGVRQELEVKTPNLTLVNLEGVSPHETQSSPSLRGSVRTAQHPEGAHGPDAEHPM